MNFKYQLHIIYDPHYDDGVSLGRKTETIVGFFLEDEITIFNSTLDFESIKSYSLVKL
jgi:hypothetical protein